MLEKGTTESENGISFNEMEDYLKDVKGARLKQTTISHLKYYNNTPCYQKILHGLSGKFEHDHHKGDDQCCKDNSSC